MSDLSEADIANIHDYMDGMEILAERNLINEYVNDVDDVREMLRLKYHSRNDEESLDTSRNNIFNNYVEIMCKLKEQLGNVKTLIDCVDFQEEFSELYRISENRIKDKMKKLKDMISRNRFAILTAGEAKAGKSTLVNLLLGTDLMPVGLTTTTRMLCEIRSSKSRRATFIADESDISRNYVISLTTNAMEEITNLVKQEDAIKYKRAIFEFPVEFLDKFTYLVDSPGIGDTSELDNVTYGHINESAPAFIFVLNATNSLGLNQRARLLITRARDELSKEYSYLLSDDMCAKHGKYSVNQMDKAIFVLNQWDVVKKEANSKDMLEEIRQSIIRDIRFLWDGSVKEETQIFFFSARQAREWMDKGIIQSDLIRLRQSLISLVSKVYERNFQNCLGVLSDILDYVERIILRKINTNVDSKYSRLYNKEHTEKLCMVLETIVRNSDERKQNIIDRLKPHVDTMVASLANHLKSEEFRNKILLSFRKVMETNKNKKPKSIQFQNSPIFKSKAKDRLIVDNKMIEHENVDIVTNILKKILEKEMFKELQKWETTSKEIENLNNRLNQLFEEQINQISQDFRLGNIFISKSTLMGAWKNIDQSHVKRLDNEIISKVEQIFIISTITLLFPVVAMAGILATPLIISHWIDSKRALEVRQKQYNINEDEFLRSLIQVSVDNISDEYVRQTFFAGMLQQCNNHINSFDKFIKEELSEKQQLIRDIERENRDFPVILQCLNVLLRRIEKCYGEYHMFRNQYLPDPSVTRRSSTYLADKETRPSIDETLSVTQTSIVFRSKKNKNVLFKMYNKNFDKQFARIQMHEVDILSTGPFQRLLRLKHMCYLEMEEKLLLVLDDADCNLYTYISQNRDLIPAYFNRESPKWKRAFGFVVDVCKQLCSCLDIIHSFDVRMVHPDLRTDTVLVTKTEIPDRVNVLICDACTNLPTQREEQRSGNNASEVSNLSFDMGGYTLENIYRLGLIFYEIAYFSCNYRSQSESITSLDDELDRMNSVLGSLESIEIDVNIDWSNEQHLALPTEYNNLIKRCLSKHPHDRPSAKECLEILTKIKI